MHKSGLRAIGIPLMAVLGLMAFFAVSAQAENLKDGGKAGKFLIEGNGPLVAGATFTGEQLGTGNLLLIHGKNAFIECEKGDVAAGSKGISETEILAVVRFLQCFTYEDKLNAEKKYPKLEACPILGEPEKETIDAVAIGLPKLHENKLYVLFQQDKNALGELVPLATVKFGPECSIGVKVKITGSIVAEVDNGNNAVTHLIAFSKAITELFQVINGVTVEGDRLFYGASEALITADADVKLNGVHLNKSWSVI